MSGRHRPSRLFRNRAVRTPLVVISALALIGAGTVILRSVAADADGCSSAGVRLTVAADPAIAAALTEIANQWGKTDPAVNGECIRVEVIAKRSHEIAESLATFAGGWVDVAAKPAPTPSESDLPVVWIPDSSYWLGRLDRVDRQMFDGAPSSVAASPVVLAIPETVARQLPPELGQHGLEPGQIKQLAVDPSGNSTLKLAMVEPRRDTAGVVGAMVLADAIVASEKDLPHLVFAYRSIGAQVDDTDALWQTFGEGITGAPVSEQALITYNAGRPSAPMAAVTLVDAPTLDFPYVVRARQPRNTAAAAAAFRAALTSGDFKTVLARHGLRSPSGATATGFPTGHGVTTTAVHVQPLVNMEKAHQALHIWVEARTPSRVLAMVDATSSMNQILAGSGKSRLQVMRDAAILGLSLFTDVSEIGLWAYAGPSHRQLSPLAPLNRPGQREGLVATMNAAAALPTDVTPLYDSILAGYKELLSGYKPELSNTLVVFTDGYDNTGKDLRAVQRELEVLADVVRPIRVILLGIGPDIKLDELNAIARTTGGAAFQVNTPEEMPTIFLKALLA